VTTSWQTRGNQEGRRQQTRGSSASEVDGFFERTSGSGGVTRGFGTTSRGTKRQMGGVAPADKRQLHLKSWWCLKMTRGRGCTAKEHEKEAVLCKDERQR
jgi:hypothetical protein